MGMICKRCRREILDDEKAVSLNTFIGKKTLEQLFWHVECWRVDFEERCVSRAEYLFKNSMKKGLAVAKNLMAARA